MIQSVTTGTRSENLFKSACQYERIFGSRCRTALAAYGTDCAGVRFWVQRDDSGEAKAALFLWDGVLSVSARGADLKEIAALCTEQDVKEVDSELELCQGLDALLHGSIETSWFMAYDGGKTVDDFTGITGNYSLPQMFEVLQKSHEYYQTHLKYEPWSADLKKRVGTGLCELYQLNLDGKPVGTGSIASQDEQVGVVATVAVLPEYRGRGLGTRISRFLVNRILEKGKQPVLISGYDEVAELYRQVGFHETGKWGELYL